MPEYPLEVEGLQKQFQTQQGEVDAATFILIQGEIAGGSAEPSRQLRSRAFLDVGDHGRRASRIAMG